jgi:hypothetical protein
MCLKQEVAICLCVYIPLTICDAFYFCILLFFTVLDLNLLNIQSEHNSIKIAVVGQQQSKLTHVVTLK